MTKSIKIIAGISIFLLVTSLIFTALKSTQAGALDLDGTISISLEDTFLNDASSVYTTVPRTVITFTPTTAINSNDGIQISFPTGFNIANIANIDVVVSQANSGTNISQGTIAVSDQYLQIPITTESDTPTGQVTITISNSHIVTPATVGSYQFIISTYDLGADNAFAGGDDTLEDSGTYDYIIGAHSVWLSDGIGNAVSATDTSAYNTKVIFKPTTAINTNDGIEVTFDSFSLGAIGGPDLILAQSKDTTAISKGTPAVSGGNILQIPVSAESDNPTGSVSISITNGVVTTPAVAGTYTVTIKTYDLGDDNAFGGSGADADTLEDTFYVGVVIGDNTVTISGTVDPTLTLTLGDWKDFQYSTGTANTCALSDASNPVTPDSIRTCSYSVTVSSNAVNSFQASVRADGPLSSGLYDIPDAILDIDNISEIYGFNTTDSTAGTITMSNIDGDDSAINQADCGEAGGNQQGATDTASGGTVSFNAQEVTYNTDSQILQNGVSGETSETVYVCHGLSILGDTPAGEYTQTVTITATGSF